MDEARRLPLEVDGERAAISGVVVSEERVTLLDFKTDRGRHAEEEYRKLLSVYYHVLEERFEDRPLEVLLFYTESGDRVEVDPLPREGLAELIARRPPTG